MNHPHTQRADSLGNRMSASSGDAVALYEQAIRQLQCYRNDPVATVHSALEADRSRAIEQVLEAQARALDTPGDNAAFTREVGAPVTRAILAFGEGDYGETVRLLRLVRNQAQRFGGSHAQRDLLDLTLIEAALRSGQRALAQALTAERIDLKPASPATRTLVRRAQEHRPLSQPQAA